MGAAPAAVSRATEDGQDARLHLIRIGKGEVGWDWQRVLRGYVLPIVEADIREPYLHEAWQRESLAWALAALAAVGARTVRLTTLAAAAPDGGNGPDEVGSALDSIAAVMGRRGCLQVAFELFHQREIRPRDGMGNEACLWLDRGLHMWRRPVHEGARASLAMRPTLEQAILVEMRVASGVARAGRGSPRPRGGAACRAGAAAPLGGRPPQSVAR